MKRIVSMFLAVIFMLQLAGLTSVVNAIEEVSEYIPSEDIKCDEVSTTISFENGLEKTINDTPDIVELEEKTVVNSIDSYEVSIGSESVFSVSLTDITAFNATNGYYAVEFVIPETDKQVFLTGLTANKVETIQNELINAYVNGKDFELESFDFIDTEKVSALSNDDNLCWAAACSNTIYYTGWGSAAGFENSDDLFDEFVRNYTNTGSNSLCGYSWFINGLYDVFGYGYEMKNENSGNYFSNYAYDKICGCISLETGTEIATVQKLQNMLRNGYGISLSIRWIDNNGVDNGGHAISMWGYINDLSYSENNSRHYSSFIISDSDSDQTENPDRRVAQNKLRVLAASANYLYQDEGVCFWRFNSYSGGVLAGFSYVAPYSEELEYETNESATKSKIDTVDFIILDTCISNCLNYQLNKSYTFYNTEELFFHTAIQNSSYVYYTGECSYDYIITDSNDNIIISKSATVSFKDADLLYYVTSMIYIGYLESGKYTLKVSVNPNNEITEAYYYNNSYSVDFTIIDAPEEFPDVSMSAVVDDNGIIPSTGATMKYSGLQELLDEGARISFYAYSYENGQFLDVKKIASTHITLPSNIYYYLIGDSVSFLAVVAMPDGTTFEIMTDTYLIRYKQYSIVFTDNNTENLSELNSNDYRFVNNEKIAFSIENTSVNTNIFYDFYYTIYAVRVSDGYSVAVRNAKTCHLEEGEATDEIIFSTSSKGLWGGTYEFYVVLVDERGHYEMLYLNSVTVKEGKSVKVTTPYDVVDEYDGLVSLREAINLCQNDPEYLGKTISFSTDITGTKMILNSPIEINSNVYINGTITSSSKKLGTPIMSLDNDSCLFNVTEKGKLTFQYMSVYYGSSDNGGAIYNDGGSVSILSCRFSWCDADYGGAIYSNGGSLKMNSVTFENCSANKGAAVYTTSGTQMDVLYCTAMDNTSKDGIIYSNGISNIISSTFIENDGVSVIGSNNTNILNSIVCGNYSDYDVIGSLNLYASYYGSVNEDVNLDNDSENGSLEEIFLMDENGVVTQEYKTSVNYRYRMIFNVPQLIVRNGVSVSVDSSGLIIYNYYKNDTISTDIVSAFTDDELSTDPWGKTKSYSYGSYDYIYCDEHFYGNNSSCKLVNTIKVTCTTDGYSGNIVCSACGYVSEYGDTIKAEGHKNETGVYVCDGNTHYQICSVCNASFGTEKHTLKRATNVVRAQCIICEGYVGDLLPSAIGDINGDGRINASDSITLKKICIGLDVEYNAEVADVYYDGKINSVDVLYLIQYISGIINSFE